MMPYGGVIEPSHQRIDLIMVIKLILDFNKNELGLVWKYKNQKMSEWFSLRETLKNYEALYVIKENSFFSCVCIKCI